MTPATAPLGRGRLFWRIYAYGLVLVTTCVVAVVSVVAWLGPPGPFHGPPVLFERVMGADLERDLGDPPRLHAKVEGLAALLGADVAVYLADGSRLAESGAFPPGPLAGPWPPLDHEHWHRERWVRTVPLGPMPHIAYVRIAPNTRRLVLHLTALTGVLVVLTLLSLPMARALTRPLEQLTATAAELGRGNLAARTGLHRDDEVGSLARAFDDMAERIEAFVRSEKELLAGLSHELRTPLARVRVALELAEEGSADPAEVRAQLAGIGQDLAELENILSNVFAIARLDRVSAPGAMPLERADVDAASVVEAAAARFRTAHPGRTFEARIPGGLGSIVGDAALLRRVFDNLLDNSAAYSDPRAPVEIEVRDRGAGVDPADLPRLFEPFFRADRSRTRATGGVGLGLTLCRRIVEAHGGKITAAPREGGGLVVSVRLPRAA